MLAELCEYSMAVNDESCFASIESAVEELRAGRMIVVVDDDDRENEGDLTMAAEMITPEAINFMATHARGLICLAITGERADELDLHPMTPRNTSQGGTAFTVSIDAKVRGVTTGISAYDRAQTILAAIDPETHPEDLGRPGHIFPLRARGGGVLERRGQTEASVDLSRLAGLHASGVICEIMNDDGSMARVPDLLEFCRKHDLKMITVADLARYRMEFDSVRAVGLYGLVREIWHMMYVHSMERAVRYFRDRPALRTGDRLLNFRELHDAVRMLAAELAFAGFQPGDRLALLLPNGPEYVQLVYACSWLGVIVVPINTRLSVVEIDRVLENAAPRGLVRHSSLPEPATSHFSWEVVLDQEHWDQEHWDGRKGFCPDPIYDPDATLALIYTSGTTGRPKGVMVSHANILADVHHVNYWIPNREGGVYLHAAPMFHIADFPAMFAAPAAGTCQVALSRFSPSAFCEAVQKERIINTVLVPTMINLLTDFADVGNYDPEQP